jgi:hypothetical protein
LELVFFKSLPPSLSRSFREAKPGEGFRERSKKGMEKKIIRYNFRRPF